MVSAQGLMVAAIIFFIVISSIFVVDFPLPFVIKWRRLGGRSSPPPAVV